MKFYHGLLALLAVLVLVFSACAAPKATAPAPQGPVAAAQAPVAKPQLTGEQQLIEAAKKEGKVVWWGIVSGPIADTLAKGFEEKYPFLKVEPFYITGQQVMPRLQQEAKVGRYTADVIYTSEKHLLLTPDWKGLVEAYEWPNTKGWPFLRGHNYYRNFANAPIGPTYNSSMVAAGDVPKSWDDLKNIRWRGTAIASTSTSNVPLFFAYLWGEGGKLNWDKSFAFWRDVVTNARPKAVTGITAPAQLHAAGESALFIMSDLSVTMELRGRGAPLESAPLSPALSDFHQMALVKNAPHPNAARLFVDYVTSYDGQITLGNVVKFVLQPEAAKKAKVNLALARAGIRVDEIPPDINTPENLKKSADFWLDLLGRY